MTTDGLTVVIPCKDDRRVAACVASIDVPVDVVIAFNGSPAGFADRVIDEVTGSSPVTIHRVDLREANGAAALEAGIGAAPTRRVLLMDSDCTFRRGALGAVMDAMDAGDHRREVFKGSVVFARGQGPLADALVRSRAYYTSEVLSAFKPPLAFDVELRAALGGYFFDARLRWKEDADLDCRVRDAGIAVVSVPGCVIDHGPLGIRTDLRSNYRYGMGTAMAEHYAIAVTQPDRRPADMAHRHGAGTAAYLWTANRAKQLGYEVTRRRLRRSAR